MKIERPTPHVMPLGRSTRFVEFGGAALTRRLMAMWCFAREIWRVGERDEWRMKR
jgi:hypothetical protein